MTTSMQQVKRVRRGNWVVASGGVEGEQGAWKGNRVGLGGPEGQLRPPGLEAGHLGISGLGPHPSLFYCELPTPEMGPM